MGRGDYNTKYRKKGMPPSRDTVWAESNITEEEREDRWAKAFGKTSNRKEINGECECTCNLRELNENGKVYIVKDDCKIHGKGEKKEVIVSDAPVYFPKRHMKAVRDHVIYGNGDIRQVMNRRT